MTTTNYVLSTLMIVFGGTAGIAIYKWYKNNQKIDQLESDLSSKEAIIQTLRANGNAQLAEQVASSGSQPANGANMLAAYQTENVSLRTSNAELRSENDRLAKEAAKLRASNASLLQAITQFNTDHPTTPIIVDVAADGTYHLHVETTETTVVITEPA